MKPKLFPLFFVLIWMFSSCLPRTAVLQSPTQGNAPNSKPRTTNQTTNSRPTGATSATGQAYIEKYKGIAIQEMNQYGIPASIKLAQALLESGNGQSALAIQANNHFGIKCGSDWTGGKSYHNDDEDNECFRVYSHPEQSFRDHSEFLLRKRYADLFRLNKDDYKGWAHGLKAAGYATNPRYAELLIDLIERYDLHQYDRPESQAQKAARTEATQKEILVHEVTDPETTTSKTRKAMIIHEVVDGDTLTSIASKYGVQVESLKRANNLRSEALHKGQLLVIQ
jgi:LysM repeat protein